MAAEADVPVHLVCGRLETSTPEAAMALDARSLGAGGDHFDEAGSVTPAGIARLAELSFRSP